MSVRVASWLCCHAVLCFTGTEALADDPPPLPEIETLREGPRNCFRVEQIGNFEVLDERNLVVMVGRRKTYHLELFSTCINLDDAFALEFRGHANRICGVPGDRLRTRDIVGRDDDPFPIWCNIKSVQALDEEGLYELSILTGKVPPPPPIPEAEIEVLESVPDDELPPTTQPELEE